MHKILQDNEIMPSEKIGFCVGYTEIPTLKNLWVFPILLITVELKVFAIFYQIFIFSSSDRPSKTMKNVFYFILKALFVLKIFKFL